MDFRGSTVRNGIWNTAAEFFYKLPNLQAVSLEHCGNSWGHLSDVCVQHLTKCPKLKTVNFANCGSVGITDAAAEYLAQCLGADFQIKTFILKTLSTLK